MPDLEHSLRSLAGRDDLFPATPDIAGGLAAQIGPSRRSRRLDWRLVAVVALVVLTALATALAIPRSRSAIADFFGIEGIRIERNAGEMPNVPATPISIGGSLLLGERTTLDGATGAAPFAVMLPEDAAAGPPDEVWLNRRGGATVVGLIWPVSAELPEIGDTGVGMLLLEIATDDNDAIFLKKMVGGGEMETAMVDGRTALWIQDGVLAVAPVEGLMVDLLDPAMRRSGNVLIWSDGAVTYRLETALPKTDAVRIAASLAPAGSVGAP
jgi:hypothetical protein